MKVSIDLHDFSILNNGLDNLLHIKEHFPDFKISMFTIPFDYPYEKSIQRIFRDMELERIKQNLDWIQIIPHGVMHFDNEFLMCDKFTMKTIIKEYDNLFQKDGLPFEKGFCAPFWLWNKDVIEALDEAGWWGAIDRNQPQMLSTKRFYKYSHSIDEPFWESKDEILKLHGHMTLPSANNLNDCVTNILKLPQDVEWHFVTDFIESI